MRRFVLVLLVLGALVGGGAFAAAGSVAKERPRAAQAKPGLLSVAALYLGLSREQLHAELRAGRSLAQVATAQGKSVGGLEEALLDAVRAQVAAAVAAARIDAAKAQRLLERAPQRIERFVNRTFTPRARGGKVGTGGLLATAATYLSLTKQELAAELRSGRSLAQIATARGKSVDGLEQALLDAFRARVQSALAAGRIDAARAQRLLERAPARIERFVNRARR